MSNNCQSRKLVKLQAVAPEPAASPSRTPLGALALWALAGTIAAGAFFAEDVQTFLGLIKSAGSLGATSFGALVILKAIAGVAAFLGVATACLSQAERAAHWRSGAGSLFVLTCLALVQPTVEALIETARAAPGERLFSIRITASAALCALMSASFFAAARHAKAADAAKRELQQFV